MTSPGLDRRYVYRFLLDLGYVEPMSDQRLITGSSFMSDIKIDKMRKTERGQSDCQCYAYIRVANPTVFSFRPTSCLALLTYPYRLNPVNRSAAASNTSTGQHSILQI